MVVIAVAAFITTAYSSYLAYSRQSELGALQEDCYRFSRSVRGYEAILERPLLTQQPLSGHLDSSRLDRLNLSLLGGDLNSPHPYNLTVADRVTGQNWTFGPPVPAGVTSAVVNSPVLVVREDGLRHPGNLKVVMWQ